MARTDLIHSASLWLDFIDARNETSHSYDEEVAQRTYLKILLFYSEAMILLGKLEDME